VLLQTQRWHTDFAGNRHVNGCVNVGYKCVNLLFWLLW
jgi:hypothetical protein